MTIEAQAKLGGFIPLWKRKELKPGTTLKWRIGRMQWSMKQEYHVLDEDRLVDRSENMGLAVEPENDQLRSPKATSSNQKMLYQEEINRADIGVPILLLPGIVKVLSWRPTGIKEGKSREIQPQR